MLFLCFLFLQHSNERFSTIYFKYLLSLWQNILPVSIVYMCQDVGSVWHIVCFEQMNEMKYETSVPLRSVLFFWIFEIRMTNCTLFLQASFSVSWKNTVSLTIITVLCIISPELSNILIASVHSLNISPVLASLLFPCICNLCE